jgi:ferric-dicitrate binding protein FerR (iron transport regulator)
MDDIHRHINNLKENSSDFFSRGEIVWKKSEKEVWAELERQINRKPIGKSVSLFPKVINWVAAVVIFLLVGFGSTVFVYTKTIRSVPGQKLLTELPDGSTVELNAGSTLKYHPLEWTFKRKLKFEGEAYFMVQKGKRFEVESANGTTQVLGTSFNIYARDNDYRVTCFSGKVKVVSNSNESVLLSPNNHVEIENGEFIMKPNFKAEKAIDWKMNRFDFTGRPLNEVFSEIERQFAVKIQIQSELSNRNFSSNFSKPENVEEVLDYVCKSMQLKFIKQSESVFLIVENSK